METMGSRAEGEDVAEEAEQAEDGVVGASAGHEQQSGAAIGPYENHAANAEPMVRLVEGSGESSPERKAAPRKPAANWKRRLGWMAAVAASVLVVAGSLLLTWITWRDKDKAVEEARGTREMLEELREEDKSVIQAAAAKTRRLEAELKQTKNDLADAERVIKRREMDSQDARTVRGEIPKLRERIRELETDLAVIMKKRKEESRLAQEAGGMPLEEIIKQDAEEITRLKQRIRDLLHGSLDVHVWRKQEGEHGEKSEIERELDAPNILPLVVGDKVYIHGALPREMFFYVLLVNPDGSVQPLFPWQSRDWDDRRVIRQGRFSLSDSFSIVQGESGMATLIVLARDTPLPGNVDLRAEMARLPHQKEKNRRPMWFESGVRIKKPSDDTEKPVAGVLAVQKRIRERLLGRYFDYSLAVSFPRE